MAKNSRDVSLVIRAKNEATKAVDAVTDALREITKASQDFQKGSSGTDSVLSAIGREIGHLNQAVQGSTAFDKLAQGSQRAENAVTRLQSQLAQTAQENERLSREVKKTTEDVKRLGEQGAKAAEDLEKQKQATGALRQEQSKLRAEVRQTEQVQKSKIATDQRASERLEVLSDRVLKAQQRFDQLGAEVAQSAEPTKRLQASYEAAGRALEKQQTALIKAQKAQAENRNELVATGQRLTELQVKLKGVESAYKTQAQAQERARNVLSETREQARGAQQNMAALGQALASNERQFNQIGQSLQRANSELKEVRQVTDQADAAIAKMGSTVRTQLLRALRDAETQLKSFRAAQAQGQAGLRSLAGTQGGRESAEFAQLAAQSRQAKQSAQEQQVAIARLRQELRAAGTDIQALNAAQQRFQERTASIGQQAQAAASGIDRQAAASERAAKATTQAAAGTQRFGNTLAMLQQNSRQTLSFMQRLRGEVIALTLSYAGLYGAIAGGRGVATAFMTLEAAQNRLGAVFNQNAERVSQEVDWLMAQADRLGITFSVLSDEYAKFAVAANVANYESAATRKIFLSVAEAGRVNKLSMEQMSGIFLALEQMISKGKVSSEELRRQLGDRLPGAFALMADALGMTTAALDEAMAKGQIFSTQDNMLRFAEALDRRFGKQLPEALKSFTTEWGRFQNELFKTELRAGQGGIIEGMRVSLVAMTEFFKSAEGQQFFNSLSAAAGKFIKVLALIPQNFDVIVALTSVFIGQKLGRYLLALTADLAAFRVQAQATAGAQVAVNAAQAAGAVQARTLAGGLVALRGALAANLLSLQASAVSAVAFARGLFTLRGAASAVAGGLRVLRAIMASLGGPIGIIITGLSILFAGWLTSASEATQATSELERQMQLLRTSFAEAAGDANRFQAALDQITRTQAEDNLDRLREQMEGIVNTLGKESHWAFTDLEPIIFGGRSFSDLKPFRDAIDEVRRDLEGGLVPNMQAFRAEIDRLGQANPAVHGLAVTILRMVDTAEDGKTSLSDLTEQYQRQSDILTVKLKPGTEEAAAAMKRLGLEAEEVSSKVATATELLDTAFSKLNEQLQDKIENKRLKDIGELTAILREFEQANKGAWSDSDLERYFQLLERVHGAMRSINRDAADARVTSGLVDRIIGVESGGRADARNPNSTATGLGQFIESTWLEMFRKHFPDRASNMSREAVLALRTDAKVSKEMVEAYARENAQVLQRAGETVSDASLYLSHFLGPQGALKVLQAAPDTPVDQLLSSGQINANQSILDGKSAAEVVAWAERKMGITQQELAIQQRIAELEDERARKQREFNEAVAAGNTDREFQLEQAKLEEQQLGRQAAIREAIRREEQRAAKDNLTLTQQQRQEIERTTGALWDQQNAARIAAEQRQQMEKRVNDLMQLRRDLVQAIEFAEGQGDQPAAERMKVQLESVTMRLREAIAVSREFWQAQTGPEAEAALASLQNLENSIVKVGHSFLLTADQINQNAATMGADGFMNFAKALADGENALDALGDAFRQFASDFLLMIARMIMQQMIFNMLQSMGFGGGVAAGVGAVFHQGGVVTTSGQGRSVSASWFANAARYHNGGIAGLRPNEVPAILERGEEVLTADDPRHRANGGATPAPAMDVKVINTIDAGSFVSEGMNTTPGQKAVLNFIKANRGQIKNLLGG